MTTREVVLDGGSPWGFRLHGGADLNQPLKISRVNPGSKAALRGIREGDFITSINNQSTKDITNAEAHTLLRNSGDTLKLGLNEDTVGSPRRRQYKTIHQETHSETVKKSSITSYTVTSSLLDDNNKTANSNINGNSRPPISSSSSSSTSTYTSITSPSGMADNGKKRKRNRRKNKTPKPEEYKVESPKRVKSPEKKPIKSRSFDDDLVIQEVSESDDKNDTKPVITEAESDPETPRNLPLPLEDTNYTEEASVMSPEEELTLRNFLEGLNLVNSPEDAFKQVHSTMESIKSRRAQKRAILEQYFNPIVQNPRFLDVINEETSDLSDREQSLTHHLKQGTPEPEITPKIKKLRKTPPNPAVLVGTRIIEVPKVTQISSTSTETSTQPEIVFLEDSSDSTTPDPKSDEEGKLEGGVGELTPPPTPKNEEIDLLKSCSKEKVLIESEITQDLENVPNSEIHKISSQNLDSSIEFAQLDTATKPVDKAEVISQASKSISDSEEPKSFTINQNLENTSNTEVNEAPAETEIPSQKPNFKCKIENIAQKEDNSEIHKFSSHNLDSSIEFAQLNTPTKPIDKAEIISKASKSISDSEEPQSSVTNHQNLEYSRFTSDETLPVDSKSRSEIPNQDTNSEKNIAQNVDQKEADSEIQEFCIQNLNSAKEFAQISQKIDDRQASKSISDSEETKSFVITQNVGNSCISEDNTKNIAKSVNLIQDSRSSSSNSEKQHLDTFKKFAQLDPSSKVVDKSQNISQNKASISETVGHKKLENSTCSDQLNKPEIYFQKIDLDEAFKSTASVSTENKNLSSSIEFAQLNPNKVVESPKNIDQNKTSTSTTSNSKIQKVFTKNLLVSSKSVDNSEFFSPKTSLYEASKSTTSDSEIQNFSARNQKSKISTDFSHLNLDLNSNFSKSISTSLDSRLFKNMEEKISEPVSSTTSESEPKHSCKTSFSKKDSNYNYKFVSTPNLQNIFYFDNFPKTEIFNNSKTEDNKCFSKCTTSFKSEKEFEKHFTSLQFSKRVNSDSKKAQSMTDLDKTISSKSVPKPREYVHKIILSDENSKSRISPKPENINASNIEVASYKSSSKPREYVHKIILSDEEENKRSKSSSKSEYFKASSKPKEYIHKIILSDDEDKVSRHRTSSKSENIDTSTINLESSKPNEYTHKIILSDDNSKTSSKPEDRNASKLDPETIKNSEIITSKSISHSEQFSKPREYVHKIILSDEESKSDLDVKRSAIKYKNFEKSSKPREYIHKIILPDKESKNSRTRASTKSENINLEYYKPKEFTHNIILCDENSKSESRPKSENLDVFKKDIESEITSFKPKEYIHQVILSDTETTSKSENIYLKSSKSTKRSENTEKSSKPKEYIHEIILSDKETSSKLENIDLETSGSTKNSENLSKPKEYIHQIILFNKEDNLKSENIEKKLEKSKPKEYIHEIILSDLDQENTKIKKSEVNFAKPPKPETLESPSREVEKICSTLTRPQSLIYTNVLTPPAPTPSPSLSSGSSRATSCTAKYNPSSSIGDITSITQSPPTLREICLNFLISQPFGADILQELADVSSSIEKLTSNLLTPPPQTNELDKCRKSISVISSNHDERQDRSNRLLAIIRDAQPSPPNFSATLPRTTNVNMASARLKAKDLTEWLKLARNNSNENRDEKQTRRTSLPQEFYFQQMHYLQQKEKEIQNELQQLENEKRKLEDEIIPKFRIEDYHISKKGDFAESKKNRPVSMPTEFFRQQMYEEYMEKIAEMEERKQQKLLKVSQVDLTTPDTKQSTIADEFMTKVKQKQQLGQLQKSEISENEEEDEILPKHLQEFISLGVWSPGQKPDYQPQEHQKQEIKNEPISPVWTPKSATSSPTVERKEFRPVKFESPTLSRKNYSKTAEEPPWKAPETSSETGILLSSTLEKRLPTSQSAPISGFNDFPTTRLPKAQNPTITLLQKAREGQLPKGALYIDQEPPKRPLVGPGEILYKIKNEYTSESESEKPPRKMADLGPRKFEGIGPTTKDGMPLILRSEVKDANQSKWYKRMYDTIHKQKPHRDEFVTVRYKQRRGQYPYTSGYLSEPEPGAYDSDFTDYKYATLDRRRQVNIATMPKPETVVKHGHDLYKNQPGRIENYIPGHSSISEKEAKEWWDEVMDIFDGHLEQQKRVPQTKSFINQALKESGYESDSTLVFRRRDETSQLSPSEQKEAYKIIQKGGDIPLHGLRKPAPERPKEPEPPVPPPKGHHGTTLQQESPRKYVENEVTIHYKTPVRQEIKEYLSEDELAHRQAEAMKKIYQEERRRKYLQVSKSLQELQDMNNRRHTDNFIPSQKSPIPLNRYDDFDGLSPPVKPRPKSPEPRLMARALYNFVGQTSRELTFRKGDLIYVRRQVDKNWYEGELNAMVGLFPVNYVEIVTYDNAKSTPRKSHEGQARAKYNFVAQTHLELSLAKGELVVITRRVDDNWFEGKIGGRKGIFPVSYVEVLIDPSDPPLPSTKPVASPAAHSLLLNGSSGGKESMGSHSYTPNLTSSNQQITTSYHAKPVQISSYGSLSRGGKNPVSQALHIETQAEPIPYRALYKYLPQNDDELELLEGDTVYVLEKCDDGWYVGSSDRTGAFGTFPGNYVEKI